VDHLPIGRKGRFGDRRRVDPDRRALPKQIFDQPVERLVRPVADIIVIAAEQRDAKVGRVHRTAIAPEGRKANRRVEPVSAGE
jgi:hypothetical protein